MNFKLRKLKIAAVIMCSVIAAGTITYTPNSNYSVVTAKTISDLEDEMAANDAEIAALEGEIANLDDDIANAEYEQSLIQQKIDKQTENLSIIETKIDGIEAQIGETEDKIDKLEEDIDQKEKDINVGLEHFKERLLAMYVSGNDSLASALVGATDFYDMLSKMELISQVAKYDNELVTSLQTQLEQYEEAKILLDTTKQELKDDLAEQQAYKQEFADAIVALNEDYKNSQEYADNLEAEKAAMQGDIDKYEKDSAAKQDEIDKINDIIMQQQAADEKKREEAEKKKQEQAAAAEEDDADDYYQDSDDDYSDSDDDYTDDDDSGPSGYYEPESSSGDGSFSGSLTWPVPGHYVISSPFGPRWGSFHQGVDISDGNTMGAAVVAADGGTVTYVATGCTHNYGKDYGCGCNGNYGNYILVDHGNGNVTWYAHCSDVYVSVGQYVSRGETIGTVGSTGWSTGAHLHFEIRVNGSAVDPEGYLY